MSKKPLIITVSAYGAMSDSTSRYRAVIVADTPDEFRGKLRDFFVNEVNRAKNIEDLSDSKITRTEIPEEIAIPLSGDREIITIPELATDYHLENPMTEIQNNNIDENEVSRNAYVFTSYKRGFCCEESEFPDAMAIYFLGREESNCDKQLCEETMHLMAWNCQTVSVL